MKKTFKIVLFTALAIGCCGSIDAKKMISRVFPFEQTQEAFTCALEEKMTVVKLVVEIGGGL